MSLREKTCTVNNKRATKLQLAFCLRNEFKYDQLFPLSLTQQIHYFLHLSDECIKWISVVYIPERLLEYLSLLPGNLEGVEKLVVLIDKLLRLEP